MNNKIRNLYEIGASLFVFGLSMLLFPSVYENSENYHFEYPDNIYTGFVLMVVGSILLLIKYYKTKKEKDENYNDSSSSK